MRSSKSRSRKSGRTNTPNRSVGNIINRVFDSSGPEGKVRGTPQQIIDKYNQLARDAQLGNDRVAMENFQQHAEHYLRLLAEAQRETDQRREQQERENRERQAERDQNQGNRDQPRDQSRDQPRDQSRDQNREQNRDQGQNRDNGRDQPRDQGRDQGRGHGRDAHRDQPRDQNRDQPRDQNRERPARQNRDNSSPATDDLQSDVLDLGQDSGLVDTPESKSEAPIAPQSTQPEPMAKPVARARSAPRAKRGSDAAQPETAQSGAAQSEAAQNVAAVGATTPEEQPKPKPRARALRKPKVQDTNGDDTSGTPEAAE